MSDNILVIPKVSIIIPIYNTAPFLRETLDSICNQSLKELDIILINDGSTDESPDIIEEYALRDHRIRYMTQPNQVYPFNIYCSILSRRLYLICHRYP